MYQQAKTFFFFSLVSVRSGRSWNECFIGLVAATAVTPYVLCIQRVITNQE